MRNVPRPFTITLVFCCLLFLFFVNTVNANELTALDILNRMKNVYAIGQSYVDEGVVISLFISREGEKRIIKKPFKTAFLRPDNYRFEFSESQSWQESSKFILHWDGEETKIYWDIQDPKVKKLKSLKEGISTSAGISAGSGRTVVTLLIPEDSPFSSFVFLLQNPQRVVDEEVDGVECYKVYDPIDYRRLTLWIGKKDFLLRKMFREQNFDDFDLEETTTYHPEINVVVPSQMLEFK